MQLPRTTEPELMNDDAQAQAYADADFAAPHEAFVDRFVARFGSGDPIAVSGLCLDIGCGPADVVIRMARRCPRLVIPCRRMVCRPEGRARRRPAQPRPPAPRAAADDGAATKRF